MELNLSSQCDNKNVREIKESAYDYFDRIRATHINPAGIRGLRKLFDTLHLPGKCKILEVGCGNGLTACRLANLFGAQVTAIDISQSMVKKANRNIQRKRMGHVVKATLGNITSLSNFDNNTFDAVVINSVLMFTNTALQTALSEIHRVLKPDGQLAVVEFAWKTNPNETLERDTYKICACDGLNFHTSENWYNFVDEANFVKIRKQAHEFNLFSVSGFLQNEGIRNAMRIGLYLLFRPRDIKRLKDMWNFFNTHADYFECTIMHARKPVMVSE